MPLEIGFKFLGTKPKSIGTGALPRIWKSLGVLEWRMAFKDSHSKSRQSPNRLHKAYIKFLQNAIIRAPMGEEIGEMHAQVNQIAPLRPNWTVEMVEISFLSILNIHV